MSNLDQKVLSYEGLQYFYNSISEKFASAELESNLSSLETALSGLSDDMSTKVDKIDGKGLSTEDYTSDEKRKLEGIASGATKVIVDSSLSSSQNAIQNKAVYEALNGIRTSTVPNTRKINNKDLSSDISLTAADVGALATNGTAASASKVNNNLIIKLNSGSTEGTNLFTFNGSGAKTINITPSAISAVPTSRTINSKALTSNITLSAADVSAVPTTRKVNNKALSADISLTAADVGALASGATATAASKVTSNLTIKLNGGTTEGTNLFTFNGSSAKTINITPANIAALPSAGGTITGNLTVNGNITIGTHNPAIKLTTEGFNYIKGTAASSIAFCLNDTVNQANSTIFINATGINPGASATYSLGTSSLKWKNLYVSGVSSLGSSTYMVGTDTAWLSYQFRASNGTDSRGEIMISDTNRIHVNQRETGASYAERYMLPTVTSGLTADVWYSILTTKSAVTVAQGGTGATTAKAALKNLGIYYQSSQPSLVEGRIWLKPV